MRSNLISSFDDGNKSGMKVLFPFCIEVLQSCIINLNSVFFLYLMQLSVILYVQRHRGERDEYGCVA